MAAFSELRLARGCVADRGLPWERRYGPGRLTPLRVHRSVSSILAQLGTPAKPPKPCGRSPGGPKGRLSGRAKRSTRPSKRLPEAGKRADAHVLRWS